MATLSRNKISNIPGEALHLIDLLVAQRDDAYLVGGCVRDLVLGKQPHDYDICTSLLPHKTINVLEQCGYRYTSVGIVFGTVVAIGKDSEEYEITTFRRDAATSGKHRPDVVEFSRDVEQDLSRRDFTINAMALNTYSGKILDFFGGINDIKNKVIRAVGDPNVRMQEDPLRILRALRFAITLGFDIEDETFKAMEANRKLLDNVSKERITAEFRKIFASGLPVRPMFLKCNKIIAQIIPEIKPCIRFNQNNRYHTHDVYEHTLYVVDYCHTTDFEIKMAALFHDIGKPDAYVVDELGYGHFYGHPAMSAEKSKLALIKDFKLTCEEFENIITLIEYHDIEVASTTKSVKKAINKIGVELIKKWFILKQADRDDHIYPDSRHFMDVPRLKELYEQILSEKQCFDKKDLNINGDDIIKELKIKPGKQIGFIINTLLDEVMNEELNNEYKDLLERSTELHLEYEEDMKA